MKYEEYIYLDPPRPENAIMQGSLERYEKLGYWAQFKKNGTCSIIYVPPKGQEPFAKTRHSNDPDHKAWQFTEHSLLQFRKLQDKHWHVFTAELLHSKGNGIRDTNYLHDVLVFESEYMLGSQFEFRQELLAEIFDVKKHKKTTSHYVVDAHTWVARNYHPGDDYEHLFKEELGPEDEGLVLKNPHGILTTKKNSNWQVKCRKAHANYGF